MIEVNVESRKKKIQILRIKNPWADNFEWNGAFADRSPEWKLIPQDVLVMMNVKVQDDGEFFMTFQDFTNYFDDVELCHVCPDALDLQDCRKMWSESIHEGKWIGGKNHHSPIVVIQTDVDEHDDDDYCSLIISLMQKNRREMGADFMPVKVDVFKLNALKGKWFFADKNPVCTVEPGRYRELCGRFKLLPGPYAVVPIVQDSISGDYMLRIFTETSAARCKVVMNEGLPEIAPVNLETKVQMLSAQPGAASTENQQSNEYSCLIIILFITVLIAGAA